MTGSIALLSGGVGGAKLALGLYRVLPENKLNVIVNTGDDFEHFGLPICPDIDTTLYTLGDLANTSLGWGRKDETWNFLDTMVKLGGDVWFKLGDKDLALHAFRKQLQDQGLSLSEITQTLAKQFDIDAQVIPMSDQHVATQVTTNQGVLAFQRYFVEQQCKPEVQALQFAGIEQAALAPAAHAALTAPDLTAIIISPSNPYLSIAPILALPGMTELLQQTTVPVIAVSPIIGGQAVKGPTVKIMQELGINPSAISVANEYASLLDGFILDTTDADIASQLDIPTKVTNTIMNSLDDRDQLAKDALDFAEELTL